MLDTQGPILNYIHGQFQEPSQNHRFSYFKSAFNFKADQENVFSVVESQAVDVVKAVQASTRAFHEWQQVSISDKINFLTQAQNFILENKKVFIETEAFDQGLNYDFSEKANIDVGLNILDQIKTEALSLDGLKYKPTGLISILMSWNFSHRLLIEAIFKSIVTGNAVIIKVSSQSPRSGFLISQLIHSLNLPAGLVQFLYGTEVIFKKLMISHPAIKAILFKGTLETSTQILKSVAENSSHQFKKLCLHSGSKNSSLILKELSEVEMKIVIDTFLRGQGQLHWNSARLFVLEKFEKVWIDFIGSYLSDLKPSESIFDSSSWTPLKKRTSLERFSSIEKQAQDDQAKIIQAHKKLIQHENFVAPFFTKDMSNCSTLQQDQVHAPAFVISTVKYGFDIPKYSNVSYYGYSSHIWSEEDKNSKVVEGLETSNLVFNKGSFFEPLLNPGFKQSFFGVSDQSLLRDFFIQRIKLG